MDNDFEIIGLIMVGQWSRHQASICYWCKEITNSNQGCLMMYLNWMESITKLRVRLEVRDVKIENDNFYILTLAGIARELRKRGKKEANVFIAAGLPLTRFVLRNLDFWNISQNEKK
jgi:plasmid segregation protein ParM